MLTEFQVVSNGTWTVATRTKGSARNGATYQRIVPKWRRLSWLTSAECWTHSPASWSTWIHYRAAPKRRWLRCPVLRRWVPFAGKPRRRWRWAAMGIRSPSATRRTGPPKTWPRSGAKPTSWSVPTTWVISSPIRSISNSTSCSRAPIQPTKYISMNWNQLNYFFQSKFHVKSIQIKLFINF